MMSEKEDLYADPRHWVLGQAGFSAYREQVGGKTYDGKDIPPWDALGVDIQCAWIVAALAVQAKLEETHGA